MEIKIGKYYRSATGTKEGPMSGNTLKWARGHTYHGSPIWNNNGTPGNVAARRIGPLITEWVDEPTAPQIEVGKTYPDRVGRDWECVFIKDDVAWMSDGIVAFRYNLDGTPIDLPGNRTIDLGPVRGEVVKYFSEARDVAGYQHADSKYKATIPALDGKPAVGTYTGENGLCVKIEEVE